MYLMKHFPFIFGLVAALFISCGQHAEVGSGQVQWQASWIGAPWDGEEFDKTTVLPAPEFRKEILVSKRLEKAVAHVCGLGFFELSVNGGKVGDQVLVPNESSYGPRGERINFDPVPMIDTSWRNYRVYYLDYQLEDILKEGENTIDIILGNGFFSTGRLRWVAPYGTPRLIFQLELDYADGSRETIVSDNSWKVRRSPIVLNDMFEGEIYDARKEDSSEWENAVTRNAPEGALMLQTGPADKIKEELEPVSISALPDGRWEVDFGDYITGWVKLMDFNLAEGAEISIEFPIEGDFNGVYKYIGRGGKVESYAPRFSWWTFRKAVISGWEGELKKDKLIAQVVYSDVDVVSEFDCSNPLLVRIHNIWIRTQKDNMHLSVPTDCPHREKGPYTGDGEVACVTVMRNFGVDEFYRKWLRDISDCQDAKTGYTPNAAPWHTGCGGGVPWGAAICIIPWEHYLHYGDASVLEEHFDAMRAQLDYMTTWRTPEGVMYMQQFKDNGEIDYWKNLGEWCPPYNLVNDSLVHTYFLWKCANFVASAAKTIGKGEEARKYAALAAEVREAFHKVFYNPETQSYGNLDGANIFALAMGVPEDIKEGVLKSLKTEIQGNGGHLITGIFGTQLFFDVLCDNGLEEMAYSAMTKTDYPSYGWWIAQGADTFWEDWPGESSKNHPMFGGGISWMYSRIAGLQIDESKPAYKHFIVRPTPVGDLKWASYSIETPRGKAAVKWELEDDEFCLEVLVPKGSSATVYMPWGGKALTLKAGEHKLKAEKPAFKADDLLCEGMEEPLGIDSALPHFSWKIDSDAPMAQSAYEIEVGPDLWDSGKVLSSRQLMIPYEGIPLKSRTQAWWRVRVWNQDGEVSAWSEKQRFGIGIIGEDRLEGEYIGAVSGEGRAPILKKTFAIEEKTSPAILYVNSLGYHEVYINGEKLGDGVLNPAVSQLDKRSLIMCYDVSEMLKKGENEIQIWAGSGWYKPATFDAAYPGPLVKAELDICGKPVLCTDASWKGAWSGYRDVGTWQAHHFDGEVIHAGTEPKWGPVDVVKIEGIAATMQMCEPCRVQETLKPVGVEKMDDGSWKVDFGRCSNSLFEIKLPPLPAGHKVKAVFADIDTEGFNPSICGWDEYISSGSKEGDTFINKFNHHVFRYVKIEGLDQAPSLESMKAHRMRTDYKQGGYFRSSDEDLNSIHDLMAWTMENLAFDGYMVDCASIERLGYGGDGNASTLSLQIRTATGPLYMNWLQAWIDVQLSDGCLPHTAPSPYRAGGGPYWCSFIVQAPWRSYVSYADARPLERCYPAMKRWLGYVEKYMEGGLLKCWPEYSHRWWYLGDWAAPEGVDVRNPESIDLVNNCAVVQSLIDLEKIALLLGEEDEATAFREKCETLRKTIHSTFFKAGENIYASGCQLDMVYPLLVGAVPEELVPAVRAKLKERTESEYDGHLKTGLVGIPVITEWASLEGECDWMYGMLKKKDYPGYLYMMENGATGVWEVWEGSRSYFHNCYNGIGSWFYQALGGIIPLEPGYSRVSINPQAPEGLDWVEVCQETPYGSILVKRNGNKVEVELPVGVSAVIGGKEYSSAKTLKINTKI